MLVVVIIASFLIALGVNPFAHYFASIAPPSVASHRLFRMYGAFLALDLPSWFILKLVSLITVKYFVVSLCVSSPVLAKKWCLSKMA